MSDSYMLYGCWMQLAAVDCFSWTFIQTHCTFDKLAVFSGPSVVYLLVLLLAEGFRPKLLLESLMPGFVNSG